MGAWHGVAWRWAHLPKIFGEPLAAVGVLTMLPSIMPALNWPTNNRPCLPCHHARALARVGKARPKEVASECTECEHANLKPNHASACIRIVTGSTPGVDTAWGAHCKHTLSASTHTCRHARLRTHSRHSHRSAHGHIQEAAASKQTRVSGTLWRASYVVLYGQLSTTIKRLSLQLSEPSCRALAASGPMRPRRSRWRRCTSPPAPHSTAQQAPFGCSPLPLWLLPDDSRWMLWRFQGVCAVVCATAAQGDRLWPPEVTVRTACLRHRLGRRQRDAEA